MSAIVVFSGGLDSTVLLTFMKEKDKTTALNFNYGSKHNEKERGRAREICKVLGVDLIEVDLPFINDLFESDLLRSGKDIPEGYYTAQSMSRTVVPFRNGIMLSIAAGLAESIKAEGVYIASHQGDHPIYPDCSLEFNRAMDKAIREGTKGKVHLVAPFASMTKADIVKIGLTLKAPLDLAWSCYKGEERPCLRCGTCQERIEAFILNGVKDPALTSEEWSEALKVLKRPSE